VQARAVPPNIGENGGAVAKGSAWRLACARRDFAAGALIFALGAAIAIAAFDLRIGTPARMGPGFLPLGLGLLMGVVGAIIAVRAFGRGEELPRFVMPRALVVLVAAFVAFAALIEPAGLIAASFAAVLIAGLAARGRRWWEGAAYAAVLAAFATIVFVELLGMPLKVWP
jgi:hypothetical protein